MNRNHILDRHALVRSSWVDLFGRGAIGVLGGRDRGRIRMAREPRTCHGVLVSCMIILARYCLPGIC